MSLLIWLPGTALCVLLVGDGIPEYCKAFGHIYRISEKDIRIGINFWAHFNVYRISVWISLYSSRRDLPLLYTEKSSLSAAFYVNNAFTSEFKRKKCTPPSPKWLWIGWWLGASGVDVEGCESRLDWGGAWLLGWVSLDVGWTMGRTAEVGEEVSVLGHERHRGARRGSLLTSRDADWTRRC